MYEQFKELADVDITTGPMEVGPTTHYVMGGIRVDAETGATTVPGLFAAGEVAGGMHGANRLGGNSLSDLLVFGAADRGAARPATRPSQADEPYRRPGPGPRGRRRELDAPLERTDGEDPYAIQRDLQATMQRLVGIFRVEADLDEALGRLGRAASALGDGRASAAVGPTTRAGTSSSSCGNLLTVSEAITRSARQRTESRGAHSRLDYPGDRRRALGPA